MSKANIRKLCSEVTKKNAISVRFPEDTKECLSRIISDILVPHVMEGLEKTATIEGKHRVTTEMVKRLAIVMQGENHGNAISRKIDDSLYTFHTYKRMLKEQENTANVDASVPIINEDTIFENEESLSDDGKESSIVSKEGGNKEAETEKEEEEAEEEEKNTNNPEREKEFQDEDDEMEMEKPKRVSSFGNYLESIKTGNVDEVSIALNAENDSNIQSLLRLMGLK